MDENGAAKVVAKSLGQSPTLLALVVLVGILLYVFGERISIRLDHLTAVVERCSCMEEKK